MFCQKKENGGKICTLIDPLSCFSAHSMWERDFWVQNIGTVSKCFSNVPTVYFKIGLMAYTENVHQQL
jgi:hypothetical protein